MLRFAFNTIGASDHRLIDLIELIAETGYQGVVLTLAAHHLDPFADDYEAAAERLASLLKANDLGLVIDTGARFLLDPRERFEPTLLSPEAEGRAQRIEVLRRAIRIAAVCGSEAVTFTAGRLKRNVSQANAGAWLLEGLKEVADAGAAAGVRVALEPQPGHIVGNLDDFVVVRDAVKTMTEAPLHLALDTGHVAISGERTPQQAVKEFSAILATVAVADMREGVHAHLPLGDGDIDLVAVLATLRDVGFEGLVSVKLPRDSWRADETIGRSIDWLLDHVPSD